jgi:plasmid stabilization system protein ParE
MTYRVVIPPHVESLIFDQARYLQSQGAGDSAVSDWLEKLYARFEALTDHPRLYRVAETVSQAQGAEVHRINHGEYAVFYRVDDQSRCVELLDFRHGRQRERAMDVRERPTLKQTLLEGPGLDDVDLGRDQSPPRDTEQ